MHKLLLFCLFLLLFTVPGVADAYLDPVTGGYIFQILFPIFIGSVAALGFFYNQIKRGVRNMGSRISGIFPKKNKDLRQ